MLVVSIPSNFFSGFFLKSERDARIGERIYEGIMRGKILIGKPFTLEIT